ncbi:hypothetical protein ABZ318_28595 [Streptomyces sp. NPDC006197]|uniref:hypothetical protein n=1 Tax=Streptomyces sp. NPDC006197 TaxID=3156685 RepID=UPI0033A23A49
MQQIVRWGNTGTVHRRFLIWSRARMRVGLSAANTHDGLGPGPMVTGLPNDRKRVPRPPTAAYDPVSACDRFDTWAGNRFVLLNDERPVGSGLIMATPQPWRAQSR